MIYIENMMKTGSQSEFSMSSLRKKRENNIIREAISFLQITYILVQFIFRTIFFFVLIPINSWWWFNCEAILDNDRRLTVDIIWLFSIFPSFFIFNRFLKWFFTRNHQLFFSSFGVSIFTVDCLCNKTNCELIVMSFLRNHLLNYLDEFFKRHNDSYFKP